MGRGSSGATAGITKLTGTDGKPITLDKELRYGGTGSGLNSSAIDRIATDGEWTMAFNEDGNVVEINGKKIAVQPSTMRKSDVRSLDHSAKDGRLGGPLTVEELRRFDNKVLRATAPEGTYTLTKGPKFNDAGLQKYFSKASAAAQAKYDAAMKRAWQKTISVEADHKEGRATRAQVAAARRALKEAERKAYNTMLVEQHDALRSGQKKYGYAYSLVKRRS